MAHRTPSGQDVHVPFDQHAPHPDLALVVLVGGQNIHTFDDRTVLTGSYNWTRSAADYNKENFLVTPDDSLIQSFSSAKN